jgi:hypothetical protein
MGSGFFTSGFFAGAESAFGLMTDLIVGGCTVFFAVTGLDAGFATGAAFAGAGLAAGFTAFLGTGLDTGLTALCGAGLAAGFLAGACAGFPALCGAGLAGAFFAGLAAFFLTAILVILFL